MENVEVKKARKRRASVFDNYSMEVLKYIKIGLSLKNIYKLIVNEMNKKPTYVAFYMWVKKNELK